MQIVLNAPMPAHYLGILTHTHFAAADEVAHLRGCLTLDRALAVTHPHGCQLGPDLAIPDTFHLMDHNIGAVLLTAMSLLGGAMLQDHPRGQLAIERLLDRRLHVLQ